MKRAQVFVWLALAACGERASPQVPVATIASAPPSASAPAPSASASASAPPTPPPPPPPPAPIDLVDPSQLEVSLAVIPPRTVRGIPVTLSLTVRNATQAPLIVHVWQPDLVFTIADAHGAQVFPPPGGPQFIDDPQCGICPSMGGTTHPPAEMLTPGASRRFDAGWSTLRFRWPARVVRHYPSCCGPSDVAPIDAGDLPPGTYTVRAFARLMPLLSPKPDPVAEATVEIVAK